jgi:hypothetical protein
LPLNLGSKKFAFYEGESLVCCPVLFMMALALADNAFENGFTSLAQIYKLVVPGSTDRIRLKWDTVGVETSFSFYSICFYNGVSYLTARLS